jgi:hypothetical protein
MFLVPACAATLSPRSGLQDTFASPHRNELVLSWSMIWLSTVALIGLRDEVGGDWGNYFRYLSDVAGRDLKDVVLMKDPGYEVLNWISVQMDWGIYGVNLMCGVFFATGLVFFCRRQDLPWVALAVAIPYMLIVVAMGYSRQGVALGIAMLGLTALGRGSTVWFVLWVVLAATFHKSAVFLLPVAALASGRNRLWTMIWVGLMVYLAYTLMVEKEAAAMYKNYIESQYQSDGTLIRLLMNAIPAVVYLKWRDRFQFSGAERRLWTWLSILSLAFLGLFFFSSFSTAIDRIALYLLPLQMAVFSRLPYALSRRQSESAADEGALCSSSRNSHSYDREVMHLVQMYIIIYYGAVQFIWLNFSNYSSKWLPYRVYVFQ